MEIMMTTRELFEIAEIELIYRSKIKPSRRPTITSSSDAYGLFLQIWEDGKLELIEQFNILLLNRANKVLGIFKVSTGGVTGTVADPKIILTAALKANACALIMAHNHPSGNLSPSTQDKELTRKIKLGAQLLDMKLLDHLIITKESYYSFGDEGLV